MRPAATQGLNNSRTYENLLQELAKTKPFKQVFPRRWSQPEWYSWPVSLRDAGQRMAPRPWKAVEGTQAKRNVLRNVRRGDSNPRPL